MIDKLPNEIILRVFLILQPPISPFLETEFPSTITGKRVGKYHSEIKTMVRKKPGERIVVANLMTLIQVCQKFRNVAKFHPIFTQFQYYRLCPLPLSHSENLKEIIKLSLGIRLFTKLATRKSCTRFDFRPINDGYHVIADDLLNILNGFDTNVLQEITIMAGWSCFGSLIEKVCEFRNLKSLVLFGIQDNGSLSGFNNRDLIQFSKSFRQLEHLHIDTNLNLQYNWKSFRLLLCRNPKLKSLRVGCPKYTLDFHVLEKICPNLESLTIRVEKNKSNDSWLPECIGSVQDLPRLKTLIITSFDSIQDRLDLKIQELMQNLIFEKEESSVNTIRINLQH